MGRIEQDSAGLYRAAVACMPGGVSHELRYRRPHPAYIAKASGPFKWDVNGRRIIDFKMGSASQLLGHCHPDVVGAVRRQAEANIFASDCHLLEIEWAAAVNALYPSADLTRFTGSGTEANALAVMLGRAYTGRDHLVRVDGHYHGWNDALSKGAKAGFGAPVSLGVPSEMASLTRVVPASVAAVSDALSDGKVGTIILEASGANYGSVPLPPGFLADVRKLSADAGAVLVFDEVITGFRWSPGGLQARDGIVPDLTTLAKVLTGGLPGGAVAGRADIMALLDPGETRCGRSPPVSHKGTFNASPLVAAGALAAIKHLSTGGPQAKADAMAERLRDGLAGIFRDRGIAGTAYGESSAFHMFFGRADGPVRSLPPERIRGVNPELVSALRGTLFENGVDLMNYLSGVTSAAHDEVAIDEALDAFDRTFRSLKKSGVLDRALEGDDA